MFSFKKKRDIQNQVRYALEHLEDSIINDNGIKVAEMRLHF